MMADDTMYNRIGECNRCGECCVGPGTFDRNWPDSLRHWSLDDINEMCPLLTMCGLTQLGEDTIGIESDHGTTKILGSRFYYKWDHSFGLGKDTSAGHDGTTYNAECPFLLPDPGDGTRPCGLVGTPEDGAYIKWCQQEPSFPRSERHVLEWQARYPSCSYTWEAIE